MPPTHWSYDTTIKDAPYDIDKAKQLLKEAGIKEGTEITLWAMPVQRPYNPNAKTTVTRTTGWAPCLAAMR